MMETLLCPLCNKAFDPWKKLSADWRRPRHAAVYTLFWCPHCAFGQVGPRPDPDVIASFYAIDDYYTHTSAPGTTRAQGQSFSQRLKTRLAWSADTSVDLNAAWIQATLGPAPKDVCDLGCGSGELLRKLRDAGHRVTGVEPDPAARQVAVAMGLAVCSGTAEMLPDALSGRRFDAVFMSHVLEHCRDPLAALRNARSLLAPGGRLIVETPNNAALGLKSAGSAWYWLDVPRHLNFFTPKSLRRCFELAGLCNTATEFRGYTRQFSADWIRAEQTIWDRLNAAAPQSCETPRNSEWNSWKLLCVSALASDESKYDSVRVLATAPL